VTGDVMEDFVYISGDGSIMSGNAGTAKRRARQSLTASLFIYWPQ